jgi:hypothetical protein
MFNKKIDDMEVAMELLRGKGLNRASFARVVLSKENIVPKDKDTTRELFDTVLSVIKDEHGDSIYKDGHDHFIKEASIDDLKEEIVKLKEVIAKLKAKNVEVVSKLPKIAERRQWLYMKGKGQMFPISEVEEKLSEGWKDHPKGS